MVDYTENEPGYQQKRISGTTSSNIEKEVRKLIDDGYQKAKKVITENIDDLHKIAKALLEYELLSGDEIKAILRGEKIIRDDSDGDAHVPASRPSVPRGGGLAGAPQEA